MLVFALLLLFVLRFGGLDALFEPAALKKAIAGHEAGGLLIFIGLFVLGNLLHVPGWIFLGVAVLTLGGLQGGIATYVAATISCVVSFLVIRLIGGDALRQLRHPWALHLLSRLDTAPVGSVFGLRLLFQTMPALNYALAMSGVRLRAYLLGTLLGLPLPIALYCLFFDSLAQSLRLI